MRKRDEIADLTSCFNKAAMDEFIFVVREHDIASPATVRFWAAKRVTLGKNKPDDPQILEALGWANTVDPEFIAGLSPSCAVLERALRYLSEVDTREFRSNDYLRLEQTKRDVRALLFSNQIIRI